VHNVNTISLPPWQARPGQANRTSSGEEYPVVRNRFRVVLIV